MNDWICPLDEIDSDIRETVRIAFENGMRPYMSCSGSLKDHDEKGAIPIAGTIELLDSEYIREIMAILIADPNYSCSIRKQGATLFYDNVIPEGLNFELEFPNVCGDEGEKLSQLFTEVVNGRRSLPEQRETIDVICDLINQFDDSGVLGAGRVARACNILAEMIQDEDMSVFMSLGGPLIPGGMRNIVTKMINEGHVDLIISSGANITHDLVEAFGGSHYRHEGKDDEELNEEGIGRIADINVGSDDFTIFEREIIKIFEEISSKKQVVSIQELVYEIGLLVEDENSFVATAARNNIPIFAPGLIDSMTGLQLWIFSQDHDFVVDAVADMHYLSDIVFESEKVGAVLLGGGLTKHYALASNVIKGGLDAAIQITMDRPEAGSLGGAPLEEAKSWAKAKCGSNLASVVGDVTVIFPLIYAAVLDKIKSD